MNVILVAISVSSNISRPSPEVERTFCLRTTLGSRPGGVKTERSIRSLSFGELAHLAVLLTPAPRNTVSYTFFLTQIDASNVAEVTSTSETIEDRLKNKASYTPTGAKETTQRPSFADDNLFAKLQSTGVPVNANDPDRAAPVRQQVLLGFGPTLLLVGLLIWFMRRASGGAGGGGLSMFGRSRAKLYQPGAGQVSARPDHRRPGRARGRGDRVRRHDDRRGKRPRPGVEHRPPDGRPVGHVRGDRPGDRAAASAGIRCPQRRPPARCPSSRSPPACRPSRRCATYDRPPATRHPPSRSASAFADFGEPRARPERSPCRLSRPWRVSPATAG
jgi:hypothetical protein